MYKYRNGTTRKIYTRLVLVLNFNTINVISYYNENHCFYYVVIINEHVCVRCTYYSIVIFDW